MAELELSFCVVCTGGADLLARGLEAIAREQAALPFATETLVLDNATTDGSLAVARAAHGVEVLALDERRGKAANDTALLRRAGGRFALLLNEDSELRPGASAALHAALVERDDAAAAGAALLAPDGTPQPSAFRFPGVGAAVLGAIGLARRNVQSGRGDAVRDVDWAHSAALLVRREAAEEVGWLDPTFFVYSDEVDLCKRLRDAGWAILHVPVAVAVHHEQLSSDAAASERRIVEFSRNRDRYLRKHASRRVVLAVRWLTALAYAERALAALVLPGHDPERYLRHVHATLRPGRGEGIREAAEAFNVARR